MGLKEQSITRMDVFNVIAGLASIAGLIISVIAWRVANALRRRLMDERFSNDLSSKAHKELAHARRLTEQQPQIAMHEISGAIRRASVHILDLTKRVGKDASSSLNGIQTRIATNASSDAPRVEVIFRSLDEMDVLVLSAQNAVEERRRNE